MGDQDDQTQSPMGQTPVTPDPNMSPAQPTDTSTPMPTDTTTPPAPTPTPTDTTNVDEIKMPGEAAPAADVPSEQPAVTTPPATDGQATEPTA